MREHALVAESDIVRGPLHEEGDFDRTSARKPADSEPKLKIEADRDEASKSSTAQTAKSGKKFAQADVYFSLHESETPDTSPVKRKSVVAKAHKKSFDDAEPIEMQEVDDLSEDTTKDICADELDAAAEATEFPELATIDDVDVVGSLDISDQSDGIELELEAVSVDEDTVTGDLDQDELIDGTLEGTGDSDIKADIEADPLDALSVQNKKPLWTTSDKQKTVVWWYLQEVSKHGLLKAQDEISLGRQIQDGNEEALTKLVAGNLRLVVSIAKRYMRQGMDFEDLIQEGNLGLMLAARKFDPSMGNKFSTYATWWIRQSITRALSNKSRVIRLPVHVNEMLFKLKRAAKPFYQKMGRPPTILELCQSTGLSQADVDHVLKSSMSTVSMDEYISGGEDETLEKFIEDKGIPRPDEQAERELLSRKVSKLMSGLATDECEVLTPLYGLDGRTRRSAKEVATSLGIEVRDVRRIEIRALRRLRRATHNRQLVDFLADA